MRRPTFICLGMVITALGLICIAFGQTARDTRLLATHMDYYGGAYVDKANRVPWSKMPEKRVPEPRPESFAEALANWRKGPKSAQKARWVSVLAESVADIRIAHRELALDPRSVDRVHGLYGLIVLYERLQDQGNWRRDAKVLVELSGVLFRELSRDRTRYAKLAERSLPFAVAVAASSIRFVEPSPGGIGGWIKRLPKTSPVRFVHAGELLSGISTLDGTYSETSPVEVLQLLEPFGENDPRAMSLRAAAYVQLAELDRPAEHRAKARAIYNRILRTPGAAASQRRVAREYLRTGHRRALRGLRSDRGGVD